MKLRSNALPTPAGKVRLCPEFLERVRREPGAREVLLAEGPTRPN